MSGQYKHPYFNMAQIFWKLLLVTCSTSFHLCCLAHEILSWLLTSPVNSLIPRRPDLHLKIHLNGSGPGLKLRQLLSVSSLHGTVCWKNDKFTFDVLKQAFLEGKASKFLISVLLEASEARHSSGIFPQARPFIPGRILRPAINKLALSICLWQRTHQADTSLSGISCFPAFDLPSSGCLSSRGRLPQLRYRPHPADSSSKAYCGHCIWGGDHLSKWLVTSPPWPREVFLMRGRW